MHFKKDTARRLLADGYQMKDILENRWIIDTIPRSQSGDPYPFTADSSRKYRWLADNAPDYLEDGWNRVALGKILNARITEQLKRDNAEFFDLGDISDCLRVFAMPEKANIDGVSDPVRLYDLNQEREFLVNLVRHGKYIHKRASVTPEIRYG